MENLEGHFLRMMMGPKCNFIRVYGLFLNEHPPPLPTPHLLLYLSARYYQLHCCIMRKICLLTLQTGSLGSMSSL